MLLPQKFCVARGSDMAWENRVTRKCIGVSHPYRIPSMTQTLIQKTYEQAVQMYLCQWQKRSRLYYEKKVFGRF